ncbi:hypothetical protein BH10PSE15_BH10PSE15_09200 [soil metagenome]
MAPRCHGSLGTPIGKRAEATRDGDETARAVANARGNTILRAMEHEDPACDTTRSYQEQGFVALPNLFPPEVLLAFYRRMEADLKAAGTPLQGLAATSPLLKGPALEVYAYHYTPMLTFLWGMTPRIALAVGRELLPTYAYFRAYQRGDICRVHSDRQACEHSLSLTIAYGDNQPWALSVERARTDAPRPEVQEDFGGQDFGSVAMRPGDGVLYQGIHHRHGRLDPNPNS